MMKALFCDELADLTATVRLPPAIAEWLSKYKLVVEKKEAIINKIK